MPHQCLSCGETFADGSQDLLAGCPSCEGTRFFYTEDPVDDDERAQLKEEAGRSAQEMLQDLMEEQEDRDLEDDIWSRQAWQDWIELKARDGDVSKEDLQELADQAAEQDVTFESLTPEEEKEQMREEAVQVSLEDVQEIEAPTAEDSEASTEEDPPGSADPEPAQDAIGAAQQGPGDSRPSTLNITNPGEYEIDVERLMEDSPVIVERDGSFVIHLPSVFERKGDK